MKPEDLSGYGILKIIADVIDQGFSFDEETGEILFEHDDLDKLEIAFDDKLSSIVGFYNASSDRCDNLKNRKKEIDKSIKMAEKKAERVKEYIDFLMKASNKTKFEKDEHKISYRKSVASEVYDEKALKDFINSSDEYKNKYFKFKDPEFNIKALSDDIKATKTVNDDGETIYTLEIPGIKMVERENIQISK